jgi:tol-pal system protein YbgF
MLPFARASRAAIFAAPILILAGPAFAQDQGRSPNFFDNLFGGNTAQAPAAQGRGAQPDEADLAVRLERLEAHIRQLTGAIEQLQFRNQQLEQQVQRLGGGAPGMTAGATPAMPPRGVPQTSPLPSNPPPVIPAVPGRRSDVFDPAANPNAPGAPRVLGSPSTVAPPDTAAQAPIGVPGGRVAGAPLDLSTPGAEPLPPLDDGRLPPPPPRNPNATGGAQVAAVAPPGATPRDEFDVAFGYVQRKDYALAEDSLRAFLKKNPSDTRVADAQYWLGESLYQRQRYRDAAESFLVVTTKHDRTPKAPEALLRLGQSLAALGENETACAAWGEIGRKYARASEQVKKNVAAEQKRVRC